MSQTLQSDVIDWFICLFTLYVCFSCAVLDRNAYYWYVHLKTVQTQTDEDHLVTVNPFEGHLQLTVD